jgi:hypothetical protein
MTKVAGISSGGLFFLPGSVSNGKQIKRLAESRGETLILPSRVRTHKIQQTALFGGILFFKQEISPFREF